MLKGIPFFPFPSSIPEHVMSIPKYCFVVLVVCISACCFHPEIVRLPPCFLVIACGIRVNEIGYCWRLYDGPILFLNLAIWIKMVAAN